MTSIATQTDEDIEKSYFDLFGLSQTNYKSDLVTLEEERISRDLMAECGDEEAELCDDVIVDEADDNYEYEEVTLSHCYDLDSVGIRLQDVSLDGFGLTVQVTQVDSSKPTAEKYHMYDGDILLQVNGQTITNSEEALSLMTGGGDVTFLIAHQLSPRSQLPLEEDSWDFDDEENDAFFLNNVSYWQNSQIFQDMEREEHHYLEYKRYLNARGANIDNDIFRHHQTTDCDKETKETREARETSHVGGYFCDSRAAGNTAKPSSFIAPTNPSTGSVPVGEETKQTTRVEASHLRTQLSVPNHHKVFDSPQHNNSKYSRTDEQQQLQQQQQQAKPSPVLRAVSAENTGSTSLPQNQTFDTKLLSPRIVPKMGTKSDASRCQNNGLMTSLINGRRLNDSGYNKQPMEMNDVSNFTSKYHLQHKDPVEHYDVTMTSRQQQLLLEHIGRSSSGGNFDRLKACALNANGSPIHKLLPSGERQNSSSGCSVTSKERDKAMMGKPCDVRPTSAVRSNTTDAINAATSSNVKLGDKAPTVAEVAEMVGDWAEKDEGGKVRRSPSCNSVSRLSQTDDEGMPQRREVYARYADVMYTNQRNLEHTIQVQQRLFEQLLRKRKGASTDRNGNHLSSSKTLPAMSLTTATTSATADGAKEESLDANVSDLHRQDEAGMEWVVKRRADGSRYITRRPVRNRLLRQRARQIADERAGLTTDDDAVSEMKTGRYWNREERKQQLERARERKRKKELSKQKPKQSPSHNSDSNTKMPMLQDEATSSGAATLADLMRRKLLKLKSKRILDDFSTMQEILSHGNRDGSHGAQHINALLSVTTV